MIQGSGFRVQGSRFRVQGARCNVPNCPSKRTLKDELGANLERRWWLEQALYRPG
jgi:hypothetical protein